jgi:transcriptional regulator with GAF, ATPase, and Fis domain
MQLSYVEVLSGNSRGKRADVTGPVIDIGRDEGNDLVLADPVVLRRHARLLIGLEGVSIEDRSSVGRTSVLRDGARLQLDDQHSRIELQPADRIELGLEGFAETVTLAVYFATPQSDPQIFTARSMSDVTAFSQDARVEPILQTLAMADRAILSSASFAEVLQHIANAALSLVARATHVTIVLRQNLTDPNDKSNDFVFALCRSRGSDGRVSSDAGTPRLVRSVFRRVVDDRAAVLAADAPSGSLASESLIGASIQSTMAVPLWHRNTIIGVLQLDNRDAPAMFDRTALDALAVLAGSASLALSNASMEQRLHQVEAGLRDENRYLRLQAQPTRAELTIVGASDAIQKLLAQLDKVARTRASVLIEGETGVGKELVAAAVHARSARADRLFVAQNCAALPENLLESELFGHVRGAFTGATEDKKGLFEVADGGTLFLDEVAEMPLLLQAKLLRVLQEGEIRPLGAMRTRQVNVRIVAACNKNLEKEVAEGRFRQDLYFRLNVFPLRVPPLRERRQDIRPLVEHFFARYTSEYRKTLLGFAEGVIERLEAYAWPGNVRELENEVQRLVIQADESSFVTISHLGSRVRGPENTTPARGIPKGTLKAMLNHVERELILSALKEHANNKTATAKALGMTREGFHKKLRQMGRT